MSEWTVFHDDGRMPHFEKFEDRGAAEARVVELHRAGMISGSILEDFDD